MPVSNLLEIIQLTEAQSQKAAAFNFSVGELEKHIAARYTIDPDDVEGGEYVLPYDDTDDTSDRSGVRFIYLEILAGGGDFFDIIHPDVPHLFYMVNNSAGPVRIGTVDGDTNSLAAGASDIIYCDGANINGLLSNSTSVTQANDFTVSYFGTPGPSEVIAQFLLPRNVVFPADFGPDAKGRTETAPDAAYVLNVSANDTVFGTISINTGGSFTFATTDNEEKTISDLQRIKITAPATPDPDIDGIQFVLPSTMIVPQ